MKDNHTGSPSGWFRTLWYTKLGFPTTSNLGAEFAPKYLEMVRSENPSVLKVLPDSIDRATSRFSSTLLRTYFK